MSRLIAFCFLTGLALILAIGFGYLTPAAHLVELYMTGLLSTATAVALAYIGGSVVDYNGGIGNLFRDERPREPVRVELPDPIDVALQDGDGPRG